ncbi:MAG TPA: folylpolyglutamate synthase/dihydrofolate synthase family protein [Rickettsiales bacterium]|nr:folylpolyglutamate synthase/dihydrofolate synthase family protein [Rickettsiales bacterium]
MPYLPHWPIPASFGKREINYEEVFSRIIPILEKLGNPHKKLPATIHVTGTNGKGSTIAFLAEILRQSNLKIDVFTSPHLHNCNERIILNGEKISDNYLYEILEEARLATAEAPLTFFEGFFLAALLAFSRSNSDVLILEVGMGARIDATNIIDKKIATIITPISFDHMEYLGSSIERIAVEKAHIIRPNTPIIISSQPKAAQKIIEIIANDQNAPMIRYDEEFAIIKDEESGNFDFRFFDKIFENLAKPNLFGEHQYINAATAIACALTLPFTINQNHISKAMRKTFWASRLEKVENGLCKFFKNKNSKVYIDGAHNQAGAFALARWILSEKKPSQKIFVVTGFSRDKCKKDFLLNFINVADEIIAIRVDGEPYPEEAEKIVAIGKEIFANICAKDDLLDAISYAAQNAGEEECIVVICGSLHLARDVKRFGKI